MMLRTAQNWANVFFVGEKGGSEIFSLCGIEVSLTDIIFLVQTGDPSNEDEYMNYTKVIRNG